MRRFRFEHWGLVAVIGWEIVFLYDVIPPAPTYDVTPVIMGDYSPQKLHHATPSSGGTGHR